MNQPIFYSESTSELVEFTRLYLAVFYSFVAAFYTVRIVVLKRRIKRELVFPGSRFCATWWNHLSFRIFRATIWMVCVVRFFFPTIDDYLGVIADLHNDYAMLAGLILLTSGFVFTIAVHLSLGSEWRSGIDPNGPNVLISNGFYSYSRNPMFFGVAVSQLGFFLALPSIFSLVCLIVGLFTLHRQTLAEEQYLSARFRGEYHSYTLKVRRWI
ncbi:methyltransferase family protein [Flocculibacter collagenilyticus]|uniref:methyltransferase family protein n=1 Tax=Flocculibacter collagenilyticus TaxID=2744479 RepID=UPI0018F3DE08|nr:isoprenylcysteine carboxylmethyltransferase family protein [Flocculibacter collagenilyticus]